MKNNKIITSFILFTFCISNIENLFSIARYKAQPLDSLQHKLQNNEIGFKYKIFNKRDCKKYLGRRRILSKGYVPVQISITNNTDQSFQFSPHNTTLSNISYNEVAQKVQFNTLGRVCAWIIPWIITTPFFLFAGGCLMLGGGMGGSTPVMLLSLPFGILPCISPALASVEGIKSKRENKYLLADYEHKTLKDTVIKPYSTINGILFINKKEYNHEFSLTVTNISNNEQHTLSTENQYIIPKKTIEPISKLVPDFTQKILSYVPLPALFTF